MRSSILIIGLLFAALACPGVASGHHGNAGYYTEKPLTIVGTVTEFDFINPHCQIFFDTKNDKGEVENWRGELTAPNKLARAGWTRNSLKPGDKVTVTGLLSKSGSHALAVHKLLGPDGQEFLLHED